MPREFETKSVCPICGAELIFRWRSDEIPHFDEIMCISATCECGFRYADTLILSEQEPVRYELIVSSPEDLNARVVRSTSGTIRVPELGMDIEPGPASESFVTNVEGVLERIKNVVKMSRKWTDDKVKLKRIDEVLNTIESTKSGDAHITIVIEDPFGNSAILSKRATSRSLTREEAAKLKTGMIVLDTGAGDVQRSC
ncbi:MAG: ZPR1 zinc finger domain-containing protein [Methanocellales archaeon]|nr:ZPR1 zinc finger domain-containing protein [Methanocellales archaeon]